MRLIMTIEIKNANEKKLIIARYFICQKENNKTFKERDIYYMWNNYFPSDFRISKNRKFKLIEGKFWGHLELPNKKDVSEDIIKKYSNKWKRYYSWIINYVRNHDIKKCDLDLYNLRHGKLREMRSMCRHIKYGAKLCNEPKNRLSTYIVFKDDFHKNGSCDTVMDYVISKKGVNHK